MGKARAKVLDTLVREFIIGKVHVDYGGLAGLDGLRYDSNTIILEEILGKVQLSNRLIACYPTTL